MRSRVCENTATTAAAMKAVRRFTCSQGCLNFKLMNKGVLRRSSFSTPIMVPAWALISMARASKRF